MALHLGDFRTYLGRNFPLAKRLYWAVCRPRKRRFEQVYQTNRWGDAASVSGPGSNLEQTAVIRAELPVLLRTYGIRSLLDVPCGDFFWMRHVDLGGCQYTGGDIVPALIEGNRAFENPTRRFAAIDLVADRLPTVDLVLCRDCLVHFSFRDIRRALARIRESRSTYLLTTTYPTRSRNEDIISVNWRPLNLQAAPFHFPPPLVLINEQCPEPDRRDKHLGLWRLADLDAGAG